MSSKNEDVMKDLQSGEVLQPISFIQEDQLIEEEILSGQEEENKRQLASEQIIKEEHTSVGVLG